VGQRAQQLHALSSEQQALLGAAHETEARLRSQLASAQVAPAAGSPDPFETQQLSQLRAREAQLLQLREAYRASNESAAATIAKLKHELAAARSAVATAMPPSPSPSSAHYQPPLIDNGLNHAAGLFGQQRAIAQPGGGGAPNGHHHNGDPGANGRAIGDSGEPLSWEAFDSGTGAFAAGAGGRGAGVADAAARIVSLEAQLDAQTRERERAERERDRAEAKLRLRAVEVDLLRKTNRELQERASAVQPRAEQRDGAVGPPESGSGTSFLAGPGGECSAGGALSPASRPLSRVFSTPFKREEQASGGASRTAPADGRRAPAMSPAQAYYESRQRQHRLNLREPGTPTSIRSSPDGRSSFADARARAKRGAGASLVRKLGDAGGKLVNKVGEALHTADLQLDRVVDAVEKVVDTAGEKGRGALGKAARLRSGGKARAQPRSDSPLPTNSFLLDND
jgi:hypothetical protein